MITYGKDYVRDLASQKPDILDNKYVVEDNEKTVVAFCDTETEAYGLCDAMNRKNDGHHYSIRE